MQIAAQAIALLVALLHLYFLVAESVLWGSPRINKVFGVTAEHAAIMKPMAANMGLYNGFLAAGLVWGLFADGEMALSLLTFFLACVAIAGVVGTVTTGNRRIVVIQSAPAALGLVLLWA